VSGQGRRVLVVEDDEAVREMLVAALADDGYRVRAAADGADGIDVLRGWRADVIVLDVVMPEADAAVFRALQIGLPAASDVPVVLLSATRASDLEQVARDLGAAASLAKPFRVDELLAIVGRLTRG
jgi:two-component system, OmpR family, response regulator MprA